MILSAQLRFNIPFDRQVKQEKTSIVTRWSKGKTVPLEVLGIIDLEQIPGISTILAERIRKNRQSVSASAAGFTLVKGIGERKAADLAEYVSF